MNYFYGLLLTSLLTLSGCTTHYPNNLPVGDIFPSVSGSSLDEQPYQIPEDFEGRPVLFLIGYKQASQFDIDRWTIGLDMTKTKIETYELAATQGMIPKLIGDRIDNGMRNGIPNPLWKSVITMYDDGETIQKLTGNEKPNNARIVMINESGNIVYFYDSGFSVSALNDLRKKINSIKAAPAPVANLNMN